MGITGTLPYVMCFGELYTSVAKTNNLPARMTAQQIKDMHTDKRYPLRACAVDASDNRIDALRRQRGDLINAVLHERVDGDQKTGQTTGFPGNASIYYRMTMDIVKLNDAIVMENLKTRT